MRHVDIYFFESIHVNTYIFLHYVSIIAAEYLEIVGTMPQIKLYAGNRYEEFDNVLEAHNTGRPYWPKKYGPGELFFINYMHFTDLINVESYDPLAIGTAIYLGLIMPGQFSTMFHYSTAANRLAKTMAMVAQGSDRRYAPLPKIFFAYYESNDILADRLDNVPAPDIKQCETDRQVIDLIYAAILCTKQTDRIGCINLQDCPCNSLQMAVKLLMQANKLDHVFSVDIGLVGHCVRNRKIRVEVARVVFSVSYLTVRQILCHLLSGITFYEIVPMIADYDFADILASNIPIASYDSRRDKCNERYDKRHNDRKMMNCNRAYKKYNMSAYMLFSDVSFLVSE